MQLITGQVTMWLAAFALCAGAHAGEHGKLSHEQRAPASRMRVVPVATTPGEPAHGWRYFRDPRHSRAVVISPGGDYYYSHGEGLALVYRAGGGASAEHASR